MPNAENFDLDFRPHSYWGPQDLRTHYGGRIKGELRRAAALDLLEEGEANDEWLANEVRKREKMEPDQ